MKKILVTGATGQIGSELVPALREKYGSENVLAAGHKKVHTQEMKDSGPFCTLNVCDAHAVDKAVSENNIGTIYHLASLLSAVAEADPRSTWEVNMGGLVNILETARRHGSALFVPSSIGAFGPATPPDDTPQDTIQRPTTIYGVTKVSGELLADYYAKRFGVDVRGLRYPGLISYVTPPGGGTTDYAVEIFYAAIKNQRYECFLKGDTRLDMMYMPDAIRAAMELMEANPEKLKHRNAFNVTAMSITPEELGKEIKKIIPGFTLTFKPDRVRQAIADSWPHHLDDSAARREWGWQPEYDLPAMTREMIEKLRLRLGK